MRQCRFLPGGRQLINEKIPRYRAAGMGAVGYHDLGAEPDYHHDGSDLAVVAEKLASRHIVGCAYSGPGYYSDLRCGAVDRPVDPQRVRSAVVGGLREGDAACAVCRQHLQGREASQRYLVIWQRQFISQGVAGALSTPAGLVAGVSD